MNRQKGLIAAFAALLLVLSVAAAFAEAQPDDAEQGLEEIRQLLEITDVDEKEGMSLEELAELQRKCQLHRLPFGERFHQQPGLRYHRCHIYSS